MRIAVFGTGGVGGYFGGRLAQIGENVVFVARGQHLNAIREQGLRVDSVKGDFAIRPAQASDDPAQVGEVDLVLVCVKAWQVSEAAQAIRPMIGPKTFVVPLENGVEAPDQLAAALGEGHVLGGLCKIIAFKVAPGHIRHAGAEPEIAFGELNNHRTERAERLRDAFASAGVSVSIPSDIRVAMWEKFLFIASISGVGAVTRAPFGVIRSVPETRRMLEVAMQEILDVAIAKDVAVSGDVIPRVMAYVDSIPANGTASMQRDIIEGRPSELEAQSGAVVRLGREAGVSTPVHAFIYHALLPLELRARSQIQF